MSTAFRIKDLRVHTLAQTAQAGTYFKPGDSTHWLVDTLISNPMSGYPKYREKRSSWGIGVLGARPRMAQSASPRVLAAYRRHG